VALNPPIFRKALAAAGLGLGLAAPLYSWEGRAELGAGPASLFSQKLPSYYDAVKSTPGYQSSNVDSVALFVGLEADFDEPWIVQLGINFGPTFDMKLNSPSGFSYSETFNLSNTYLMPGLRFHLGQSGQTLGMGIPLGYSFVSGSGNFTDPSGTSLSQVGGWAFTAGVTLRYDYQILDWISAGTDASYIQSGAITPSYALARGSTLYSPPVGSIDMSGPRCRIYLSLHPNMGGQRHSGRRDTGPLGQPGD